MVPEHPSPRAPSRSLSALSAAQRSDRTLENLLRTLTTQLDLSARLPVFEYEADADGHPRSADAFHSLAIAERTLFEELLASLRLHLADLRPAVVDEDGR